MNTTFTINLDATPELVGALNNLAAALKGGVAPRVVEDAPDHTPEPQKLKEMQDKVIADIRQELEEEAPKAAKEPEPEEPDEPERELTASELASRGPVAIRKIKKIKK